MARKRPAATTGTDLVVPDVLLGARPAVLIETWLSEPERVTVTRELGERLWQQPRDELERGVEMCRVVADAEGGRRGAA